MPISSPNKGEKEDAFIARCMGDDGMVSEFPDNDQRAAVCYSAWRKRDNCRLVMLKATTGAFRVETFNGAEHIVLPTVALMEGVFQGILADTPEFVSADVLMSAAQTWNGRPVMLDHPEKRGVKVSANLPDVLEESVGSIFNARVKDKKLHLEAWINEERLTARGDAGATVLAALKNGETVEVSVGGYVDIDYASGEYEGQTYGAVWLNIYSDHLALLPIGMTGACSVEQGCGAPRLNEGNNMMSELKVRACTCTNTPCKCGTPVLYGEQIVALRSGLGLLQEGELSDSDRRVALKAALQEKEPEEYCYIICVYTSEFIYETYEGFYRRTYSIDPSGVVTLGEEAELVRPETAFVPVRVNQKEPNMATKEKVDKLIANTASAFTEDDRAFLEAQSDDILDKMTPLEVAPVEPPPITASEEEVPPATAEEFLAKAPSEIRSVLEEGLNLQRAARDELIQRLSNNKRCEFTKQELEVLELKVLRRLDKLATPDDFAGRGGPRSVIRAEESNTVPAPPPLFPKAVA